MAARSWEYDTAKCKNYTVRGQQATNWMISKVELSGMTIKGKQKLPTRFYFELVWKIPLLLLGSRIPDMKSKGSSSSVEQVHRLLKSDR